MSKQSTRSKSKQRQANSKPANSPANAATRANGAPGNGATTKSTGGLSNGVPAKTMATSAGTEATTSKTASTTSTTQKAIATQSKPKAVGTMPSTGGAAKQPDSSSRPASKSMKQQRKQQKVQNRLAQQQHEAKQRRTTIMLVVAAFVVVAGLLTYFFVSNAQGTQGHTVFDPDYPPIDNAVYCDQLEQTAFHHHVLLTIYIDGQPLSVPAGVGLAGNASSPTCYYWLHTHDTTGIIHIEAPSGGSYTLKEFLDVWQSFANTSSTIIYPSQLASSAGWTVYINGKKVNEDFSHVDISSDQVQHELITIMYNSPSAKPLTTYSWPSGY